MNCQELTQIISNIKLQMSKFDGFVSARNPEEAITIKDNINTNLYPCLLAQLDQGKKEERLRERLKIRKGYSYVAPFHSERAFAQQQNNGKCYVIDIIGNKIGDFAKDGFDLVYNFDFFENRACVKIEGKHFLIDSDGNKIGDGFEWVSLSSDNRARVKKDGKFFFIDPDGNKIGNFAKDGFIKDTGYFSNNRAWVYRDGKYFFIDPDGNKIGNDAEHGFEWVVNFSINRAQVRTTNGEYLYIDLDGNFIK